MIQYQTSVDWDASLIDLQFTDIDNPLVKGLVCFAIKITAGAPTATAGKFIPGATIANAVTGIIYQNTGTTASPVWSVMDTSPVALPELADGDIWVGNGDDEATAVTPSGDVTMDNAGVFTIENDAVTTDKIADNAVTGAKIALASQAAGDIMYYNGTDWIRLAKGTAGQVLTMNAGATAPEWATP